MGNVLGVDGLCVKRLVELESEGLTVRIELWCSEESGGILIVKDL